MTVAFNTGSADIPRLPFCIQRRQCHRFGHCYRRADFIPSLLKFTPRSCRSNFSPNNRFTVLASPDSFTCLRLFELRCY